MVTREGILNADGLQKSSINFDAKKDSLLNYSSIIYFSSENIIHEMFEVSQHALVENRALLHVLLKECSGSTLMLILIIIGN
jgi:hypothetical protein